MSAVVELLAVAGSAAERVGDALSGGDAGWIVAALLLHVSGQVARGLGWHEALAACWPAIARRRACAGYVCGAGLSGVLSACGGDAVRIGLAKRELPGATWPALTGAAVTEGGAQTLVGFPAVAIAIAIGVSALHLPPTPVAVAIAAAGVGVAVLATRSSRVRRLLEDFARGCAALRHPRRFGRILGWELTGRLLRLAAVACFLQAFGLPTSLAAVVTVGVVYGSAGLVPIPGAGTAASAGALLVALPIATGHSVDASAVSALAIAQPLLLTAVGVTTSLILLAALLEVRTPAALLRSGRSLIAQPSGPAG